MRAAKTAIPAYLSRLVGAASARGPQLHPVRPLFEPTVGDPLGPDPTEPGGEAVSWTNTTSPGIRHDPPLQTRLDVPGEPAHPVPTSSRRDVKVDDLPVAQPLSQPPALFAPAPPPDAVRPGPRIDPAPPPLRPTPATRLAPPTVERVAAPRIVQAPQARPVTPTALPPQVSPPPPQPETRPPAPGKAPKHHHFRCNSSHQRRSPSWCHCAKNPTDPSPALPRLPPHRRSASAPSRSSSPHPRKPPHRACTSRHTRRCPPTPGGPAPTLPGVRPAAGSAQARAEPGASCPSTSRPSPTP